MYFSKNLNDYYTIIVSFDAPRAYPIGTASKSVLCLLSARKELGEAQPEGRDNDHRLQAYSSLRQGKDEWSPYCVR